MTSIPIGAEYHIPVMPREVLDGLRVVKDKWYLDATIGGGGHTELILEAGGKVLGIDQDDEALNSVRRRLPKAIEAGQLRLVKANFADLFETWQAQDIDQVAGLLLDLGVSSHQLNQAERGFTFNSEVLDMRMDRSLPTTAADLVNQLGERDMAQLFADLGEERYARHFAKVIVAERADSLFNSAKQLSELIYRVSPPPYRRGPIHPATRVFQALRMAVNAEMDVLSKVLPQTLEVMANHGRLVVISFHSLEDRQVKRFMLNQSELKVLTKRPMVAGDEEISHNPRSRSAKLRIGEVQR